MTPTRTTRAAPRMLAALSALLLQSCGGGDNPFPPDPGDPWPFEQKVDEFRNAARDHATQAFTHAAARPLPAYGAVAPRIAYTLRGRSYGTDDYVQRMQLTGLLVLKDGAIVLERYAHGNDEHTLWDSKSVGKSIVSTLVGVALREGRIPSLDVKATDYLPELAGSGYKNVSLKQLLQMSSGVGYDEDDHAPGSDVARISGCLKAREAGCILRHMASLPSVAEPGTVWNYSSGEAHLTALLLQRATGMNIADYLGQKIWRPYGMEADGFWLAESDKGPAFGGGGFNATLRDYGRFGLYLLNDGVLTDGTKTLPDRWLRDATRYTAKSQGIYGYMWWFNPVDETLGDGAGPASTPTSDWTFSAIGVHGQLIAINQKERMVIVQWAAWDQPSPDFRYNEQAAFVNAVALALH
jgi:CubicO group peptidase (beta-lactamase class C family)